MSAATRASPGSWVGPASNTEMPALAVTGTRVSRERTAWRRSSARLRASCSPAPALQAGLGAHDLVAVARMQAAEPQLRVRHPLLDRVAGHVLDLGRDVGPAARRSQLGAVGDHRKALHERAV